MKNYLIIGASTGIGRALAQQLAAEGHQVWGTYHQHPLESESPNLSYHALNVLDETHELDFLPDLLDGWVYCPGSINLRPFHRIKAADFVKDYELQVGGAIKLLQASLKHLKAAEQAAVVFFSTVAVQCGYNFHSQVAASKGALEGLTRALAAEFAPHIRVNCVAPSLTDTPLAAKLLSNEDKRKAHADKHPLKKVGTPADLAQAAAYLLSEQSSWMTGQILHVDGGMSSIRG